METGSDRNSDQLFFVALAVLTSNPPYIRCVDLLFFAAPSRREQSLDRDIQSLSEEEDFLVRHTPKSRFNLRNRPLVDAPPEEMTFGR